MIAQLERAEVSRVAARIRRRVERSTPDCGWPKTT